MNTPQMIPNTVEQVSVEWLLQHLGYSVDWLRLDGKDGWENMRDGIVTKASDFSFKSLCETIAERGFRVPACVCLPSDANGYDSLTLGNGHHRFTYAILFCLDTMPVYWHDGSNYMSSKHTDKESDAMLSGDSWGRIRALFLDE